MQGSLGRWNIRAVPKSTVELPSFGLETLDKSSGLDGVVSLGIRLKKCRSDIS